jgi:hypothetical protein
LSFARARDRRQASRLPPLLRATWTRLVVVAAVATTACGGISFENDNQVEGVYDFAR